MKQKCINMNEIIEEVVSGSKIHIPEHQLEWHIKYSGEKSEGGEWW